MFGVLWRLLFPPHCFVCQKSLEGDAVPYLCSLHLSGLPAEKMKKRGSDLQAFSLYRYEGDVPRLIQAFKYEKKRFLIRTFSALLRERLERQRGVFSADAVVAVPLTPQKEKERGFNQAALLAAAAAGILEIPFEKRVLVKKTRRVPLSSQAALSREERMKNIHGSFAAGGRGARVAGKKVLLVDDVITTGATAGECARVLQSLGATDVAVLTLACTPLHQNGG